MSLTTNLVAYYKLDESSGNAADSVGSNTLVNTGVTYSAGKINNGAVFNGSSAYMTDASFPTVTGSYTVAFWFKPASLGSGNRMFASWANGIAIDADSSTTIHAEIGNGASWLTTSANATVPTMSNGTWYYVAYVVTSTGYTIYFNGSSVGSGTWSSDTPVLANATLKPYLGSIQGTSNFYSGMLDEIGIWSRALSSTEVTQLYNGGAGLQYPFTLPSTTNGNFLNFM